MSSSDRAMEKDDREVPDYGFGMSPISETMRERYDAAVEAGRELLHERSMKRKQLDDLSELKGMFSRCYRKDQWDWSSVHRELGRPNIEKCGDIARIIKDVRDEIKYNISEELEKHIKKLEEYGIGEYLQHYVYFKKRKEGSSEGGWVYMISKKREPDLIKIGRTEREPFKRVSEINSATGVAYPYSIRKLFKVSDSYKAEKMAHDILSDYRVRSSREFFRVSFEKAVEILEDRYQRKGILADRSKGTLKWFNEDERYGFIEREEKSDVFLHISGLVDTDQVELLQSGSTLEFGIRVGDRGPKAVDAIVLQDDESPEG